MSLKAVKENRFPRSVHLFTLSRWQSKRAQGQVLELLNYDGVLTRSHNSQPHKKKKKKTKMLL